MRLAERPRVRQSLLAGLVAFLTFGGILLQGVAPMTTTAANPLPPKCDRGLFATEPGRVSPECQAGPVTQDAVISGELPSGFLETVAWSDLVDPTAIRFAADGRAFVAEKSGVIKVFHNLADTTPTVFSQLPTNVHNFWDHGLLGMALDPSLTGGTGNGSYVYVLYAYDHVLGSSSAPPRWNDDCPAPPGPTTDGCVTSGRLSRFAVSGDSITGSEEVLVEDWCQQFTSHTVGSLAFGPDGALYVSGGDGASYDAVDYGQFGGTTTPIVTGKNPCNDPPGGVLSPPSATGGALRSQAARNPGATHPTLDGAILRLNPTTGAGMAGNPFAASSDANARRILAYGLRNPFRIAFRPGTNELWLGDVGWEKWEEINRITNVTDGVARNFGWPCYEGSSRQGGYDATNLDLCETLYAQGTGAVTGPVWSYDHAAKVLSGDNCPIDFGSSTTGITFYPESGGSFPAAYRGGLFFADHTRNCIWFMPKGSNGQPDPAARIQFLGEAAHPVDLQVGPGGDLFYVDLDGGTIRRIAPNALPIAIIDATPTSGAAPLTVQFSGSRSSDPEGGPLSYAWDLDGDGQYDDATGVTASRTYSAPGNVTVGLKVTDSVPASGTTSKLINVGNDPPVPVINSPTTALKWKVGDLVSFSGSATDPQEGALPASKLSWSVMLMHCPSACHPHTVKTLVGAASGSFTAPDHELPSYIELKLTATDSLGLSASKTVRLDPRTVVLTFATSPAGFSLVLGSASAVAPTSRTVIVGSSTSVTATSPQVRSGLTYAFGSWSDGLAQSHIVVAPATNTTYTATYRAPITIRAKADAYVGVAHKNTNYGGSSKLKVKKDVYRSYVKFAVTGLTKPATSAKLRLWVTNPSTSAGSVYFVSNAWTQSTITWNNAPKIGSSPRLALLGTTTTGTWVEIDVTSKITKNGSFSFRISAGNTNQAEYASRETSHDPVLIVTP